LITGIFCGQGRVPVTPASPQAFTGGFVKPESAKPSKRHMVPIDARNTQERTFNWLLTMLVACVELGDAPLTRRYSCALEAMYSEALRLKK